MSGLEDVALYVGLAWLALLSLVCLLLVRQIGLMTVRLDRMTDLGPRDTGFGPDIGTRLPDQFEHVLGDFGEERGYLLFLDADCVPCRRLAEELADAGVADDIDIAALVAGPPALATDLANLLPASVPVTGDPAASELARSLDVRATPFALEVRRRFVTGHSLLGRGLHDLLVLYDSHSQTNAEQIAVDLHAMEVRADDRSVHH